MQDLELADGGRPQPAPAATDPLSPRVAHWLNTFTRALRGVRLYPAGNPVLEGYFQVTYHGLLELLHERTPIGLRVREDRLFFGEEVVLLDPDRRDGLPFTLFRSSIRQLDFHRGIDAPQTLTLLTQIAQDYSSEANAGEDLVTTLWRLQLPNVDYVALDVFSLAYSTSLRDRSALTADDQETERIREELEEVVQALSLGEGPLGDDRGRVMATDPLSQPEGETGGGANFELDRAQLQERVRGRGVTRQRSSALASELGRQDQHDGLVTRLTELLLGALRAEPEITDDTPGWQLLARLIEVMLSGLHFREATEMVTRVQRYRQVAPTPQDELLLDRLLVFFGSTTCVERALAAIDGAVEASVITQAFSYLRAVGQRADEAFLSLVERLERPATRRQAAELVVELARRDPERVVTALAGGRSELVRDVLDLSEAEALRLQSTFAWLGLEHDHPAVRARAIHLLRQFTGIAADRGVAQGLTDPDTTVAGAALRAAAGRSSSPIVGALTTAMQGDDLDRRETAELRLLFTTYATALGERAVPLLEELLTKGRLGIRSHSTDVQITAAWALGGITAPSARAALEAGTRTLNRRVRAACQQAMTLGADFASVMTAAPAHRPELEPRPGYLPQKGTRRIRDHSPLSLEAVDTSGLSALRTLDLPPKTDPRGARALGPRTPALGSPPLAPSFGPRTPAFGAEPLAPSDGPRTPAYGSQPLVAPDRGPLTPAYGSQPLVPHEGVTSDFGPRTPVIDAAPRSAGPRTSQLGVPRLEAPEAPLKASTSHVPPVMSRSPPLGVPVTELLGRDLVLPPSGEARESDEEERVFQPAEPSRRLSAYDEIPGTVRMGPVRPLLARKPSASGRDSRRIIGIPKAPSNARNSPSSEQRPAPRGVLTDDLQLETDPRTEAPPPSAKAAAGRYTMIRPGTQDLDVEPDPPLLPDDALLEVSDPEDGER